MSVISSYAPAVILEVAYLPFIFVTGVALVFMAKSIHRPFSVILLSIELAIMWMIALAGGAGAAGNGSSGSYAIPIASTIAALIFIAVIWRRH